MSELVEILSSPDKSPNDKKDYRIIKLSNGLTALLISAPTAKPANNMEQNIETASNNSIDATEHASKNGGKAAVGLCVDVGSFSDPPDVQGLAHFLEHMMFLGSEKYPIENEFSQYIARGGGDSNASTDSEETTYYFDVNEEHLDGAFDRFANLFKSPLLRKEAMTRERDAVEYEFSSHLSNDTLRMLHLLFSLGRSHHPVTYFAWGNLKTLKDHISDDDLYDKVHRFRRRHYSAHRMYLCIQARRPLNILQELVVTQCSTIPNNGLPGIDFSMFNCSNAFQEVFSSKIYIAKTVDRTRRLAMSFCMESQIKQYKCKPDRLIAYLLEHAGPGGLLAYLKRKLYALSVTADLRNITFSSNSLYSIFGLTISLTPTGFDNIQQVIGCVFSYLRFIQKAGPQEWLFNEFRINKDTEFQFHKEQEAIKNVEDFGRNLKNYPNRHVLTAKSLYLEYDADVIQKTIDALNAENMNIMIMTGNEYLGHKFNMKEKWYGSEYCTIDYPEEWKRLWIDAQPYAEFVLPSPNPLIATDFKIVYDKETSETVTPFPDKIYETDVCELWFRQDDIFLTPNVCYYFQFISPMASGSDENDVMIDLYATVLNFKLSFNKRLYHASSAAGLVYRLNLSDTGLLFTVTGYKHKLHIVIEEFAKTIMNFTDDLTESQLNALVEEKLRDVYSAISKPCFCAGIQLIDIIRHTPTQMKKFEYLKIITLENFKIFSANFVKQMKIRALIQGNIDATQAKEITKNLLETMQCSKIEDVTCVALRAAEIPLGAQYIRYPSLNDSEVDTGTVNYYQIGPISIRQNCILDLLVLVATEPLFNELRTKQQLAYDVSFYKHNNYQIFGYSISLESQERTFNAEYIEERIEAFRMELLEIIENISSENFEMFKDSSINMKLTDDKHLIDEADRNWAEITSGEYLFDRRKREVEYLKSITHDEVLKFYRKHYNEGTRKLSIQVIGNNGTALDNNFANETQQLIDEPESMFLKTLKPYVPIELLKPEKGNLIRDIDEFKKSMTLYPVSKNIN